ncbi:MAG: hypothetical protein AB1611_21745 [bacterium]
MKNHYFGSLWFQQGNRENIASNPASAAYNPWYNLVFSGLLAFRI